MTYRSAYTRPRDKADQDAERLGRGESLRAVRHNWPKPDRAADFWRTIHRGQPHVQVELPL